MVAIKSDAKPEIVVIVGETASGKSTLAMKVAEEFEGEIIAADSWTVYKDFNIGTAKPSLEDRKKVKHHLVDAVDAREYFSAPRFKRLAETAIADIQTRGKLPIIVGGTGLYVDSLLFGYEFLPRGPHQERDRLNRMTIEELIAEAKKKKINLSSIDIRNKRRIIRAIESSGQLAKKTALRRGTLIVGLKTDRQELQRSIIGRVELMFKEGLEQEVARLCHIHGWDTEPMKGIGYKEFRHYFEGKETLETTKQRIVSSTLNLAKRQRTWFKRNPSIHWSSSVDEAYRYICSRLNT